MFFEMVEWQTVEEESKAAPPAEDEQEDDSAPPPNAEKPASMVRRHTVGGAIGELHREERPGEYPD